MAELSHKPARKPARRPAGKTSRKPARTRPRPAAPPTVADALYRGARRLARARVFFGHGTDNAGDEAAALLWSTLGLSWPVTEAALRRPLRPAQQLRYDALLQQRIDTRLPAAYLTGETFFAGLPMRVDPRALVPRSPLAELIERQFRPWIAPARARHILDLCTGGGCIALACAHHLPWARVEGADISREALALARENRRRLGLSRRVRLTESDHFSALGGRRYDIIVSNPPYVGADELRSLPPEYGHEPRLGLAAGREGLDSVRVILKEAARHLTPGGVLVVEVGNTETAVRRRWPRLPFTWLGFERGGGGVFLLTREQLVAHVR